MEFLWKRAGTELSVSWVYPPTFDELLELGNGLAGTPDAVAEALTRQLEEGNLNYVACQMAFGDMRREEIEPSVRLFASQVLAARATTKEFV